MIRWRAWPRGGWYVEIGGPSGWRRSVYGRLDRQRDYISGTALTLEVAWWPIWLVSLSTRRPHVKAISLRPVKR